METLREVSPSYITCLVQLKNGTPVFWKKFSFSRKSVSNLK